MKRRGGYQLSSNSWSASCSYQADHDHRVMGCESNNMLSYQNWRGAAVGLGGSGDLMKQCRLKVFVGVSFIRYHVHHSLNDMRIHDYTTRDLLLATTLS